MANENVDLTLTYEERAGDLLFLLGTILAFISNYQEEQALLTENVSMVKPKDIDSAMSITAASWLFFLASILFTHVAIVRLEELGSTTNLKTSLVLTRGTKLAVIGNLLKSAGFGIAAIAYQLKLFYYKYEF